MHTPESLIDDPHLRSVGFFETMHHPSEGELMQMRRPSRWLSEQAQQPRAAPRLGEHTRAMLAEAGYSEAAQAPGDSSETCAVGV